MMEWTGNLICSSWGDNPAQVRDSWGSANFRGVCDEHDRCYYTIGASVDGYLGRVVAPA
jgi:hypothetical protein